MKRKSIFFIGSADGETEIHLDYIHAEAIKKYIFQDERHRKKFMFIAEIILSGLKNPQVYDKENINKYANDITAMKFFKGQENDRIYCKEYVRNGKTQIVVAILLIEKKKTNHIDKRIRQVIEVISNYDYEF
jgi:hypothetical protein